MVSKHFDVINCICTIIVVPSWMINEIHCIVLCIFQGRQTIANCRFYRKQEGFFNSIDSLFSLILIADFEFFTMYGEAFFCAFFCFSDSWFICLNCCVAGKFVALGKIINFPSSSYALSNGRSISSCTNSSNFSKHCCKLSRMSVFKAICAFGKLSANPSFWQPVQQFQAIKQKPCPLPYIREEIFAKDILDLKLDTRLLPR